MLISLLQVEKNKTIKNEHDHPDIEMNLEDLNYSNQWATEMFATAEFAKINNGEGTSNQGGNSRNGTQIIGNVHNATFHHGGGNNNAQHHQNPYGKLTRLDFPRFNRDDGEESTTALIWHLHFVKRFGKNVPWELYETEILRRFGDVYDDLLVELKILKQSGDVQSY
ncbi:hypothetical protein Tco_1018475 [Tanacetum coccineum]|uniref:Uncharacterized protein n=1 Tax=Tanacetum coccineum TaxID=301880 RepID=A0ABQ5FUG5_9ASTR